MKPDIEPPKDFETIHRQVMTTLFDGWDGCVDITLARKAAIIANLTLAKIVLNYRKLAGEF